MIVFDQTNAILQESQQTNKELLDFIKTNLAKTNTLLEQLKAGEESCKMTTFPNNTEQFLEKLMSLKKESKDGSSVGKRIELRKMEVVIPSEGFGLVRLDETYWKRQPQPEGTKVFVELHPKAISNVNSKEKKVGLEMHMKLVWEDNRIHWQGFTWTCGDVVTFNPNILA